MAKVDIINGRKYGRIYQDRPGSRKTAVIKLVQEQKRAKVYVNRIKDLAVVNKARMCDLLPF